MNGLMYKVWETLFKIVNVNGDTSASSMREMHNLHSLVYDNFV